MGCDLVLSRGLVATPERFLWCEGERTAVVADVHLGIEESLARAGFYVPDLQGEALRRRWKGVVDRRPERVVVAGDLFDRPEPGRAAVEMCWEMLRCLPEECRVTVIRGNHDPAAKVLKELIGERVEIADEVRVGEAVISHGDVLPGLEEGGCGSAGGWVTWVVGHQHPAVTLRTAMQGAKMACFAGFEAEIGGRKRRVIVLPAFSPAPLGCNLLSERQWLLPVRRPGNGGRRVAGIVEKGRGEGAAESQVLDFGTLAGLEEFA